MTRFSLNLFEGLWVVFQEHIMPEYNVRRGRKCNKTAKDLLFVTMAVLKHVCSGLSWERCFKCRRGHLNASFQSL